MLIDSELWKLPNWGTVTKYMHSNECLPRSAICYHQTIGSHPLVRQIEACSYATQEQISRRQPDVGLITVIQHLPVADDKQGGHSSATILASPAPLPSKYLAATWISGQGSSVSSLQHHCIRVSLLNQFPPNLSSSFYLSLGLRPRIKTEQVCQTLFQYPARKHGCPYFHTLGLFLVR